MIEVDPSGPAAERGVKTGDVILDVGGKAVQTPPMSERRSMRRRRPAKRPS